MNSTQPAFHLFYLDIFQLLLAVLMKKVAAFLLRGQIPASPNKACKSMAITEVVFQLISMKCLQYVKPIIIRTIFSSSLVCYLYSAVFMHIQYTPDIPDRSGVRKKCGWLGNLDKQEGQCLK